MIVGQVISILLSIVNKNMNSSSKDLLKTDNFTAHQKKPRSLAIHLFKVIKNPLNAVISGLLQTKKITNNIMQQTGFSSSYVNTSRFGLN